MEKILIAAILSLSLSAQGGSHEHKHKEEPKKHGHKAHEHGHAQLLIVVSKDKAIHMEADIPAESIYGFEHVAKSDKDKKTIADQDAILKDKAEEIFSLPASCKFTVKEVKIEREDKNSKHSAINYHLMVECGKSLAGQKMKIALGKFFPKIEDLDVSLVGETKQSSVELEKAQGEVTFP